MDKFTLYTTSLSRSHDIWFVAEELCQGSKRNRKRLATEKREYPEI